MAIITVKYKDTEYEERKCEHIHCSISPESSKKEWSRWRGKEISIDTDTFRKGDCSNCDTWLIFPVKLDKYGERYAVVRGEIEIGD